MTASDEILALLARVDELEKAAIKDQSITEAWHLGHWKADMEFAREARKENALLNAALAESRGRMRAVLVDKAKMLKQEDCDCGSEGGTLESGTAEVVCHGHEILEAMSKAIATPTPPQQEKVCEWPSAPHSRFCHHRGPSADSARQSKTQGE